MDAQSVHESPEGVVPTATSGFDHHKKVNGRKRHLLVDTMGLLIAIAVTRQRPGRAGAAPVLKRARARGRRRLARAWADNAYHGDWVVERTHAWTARRRRCARDCERLTEHHEAFVEWSAILLMTRRLTASSAR